MKTTERLEELLDQKDALISELESELEEKKREDDSERYLWARPRTLKDAAGLPVPRLQIRYVSLSDDGYHGAWEYGMIYRHTLAHIVYIPLGYTTTQGNGHGVEPVGTPMYTPFREGVHIVNDAKQLNLPAFVIRESRIVRVFLNENGHCDQEDV